MPRWKQLAGQLPTGDHLGPELLISIKDQILVGRLERKCFSELLNNPVGGRMGGDMEVQYPPPTMRDQKEAVQHTKSKRRYREEVHRRDSPHDDS